MRIGKDRFANYVAQPSAARNGQSGLGRPGRVPQCAGIREAQLAVACLGCLSSDVRLHARRFMVHLCVLVRAREVSVRSTRTRCMHPAAADLRADF